MGRAIINDYIEKETFKTVADIVEKGSRKCFEGENGITYELRGFEKETGAPRFQEQFTMMLVKLPPDMKIGRLF